ncbi:TonB-dependent receptor, partial [Sphingomonas sp. 66-10]
TFSVAPQWKIRPNLMVYARVASGYRPGGPNINCGRPFVACTYGSDRTVNYELGLKGDFFDRLVSIDASAYLIDWDDIQTLVATPNGRSGYTANGGTARSQGVELSMTLRPSRATTIEGWVAYNDSKLTEDFPAAARLAAFKGDRLPYSARWSGNISANHTIALSDTTDAFFGGNLSYVGKRIGTFQPDPLRAVFPSYWQFDLTAGLKWNNGWRFNAFVNNLTNERGILRAGADSNIPTAVTYIRPRSFGVAVSKSF